MSGCQGKPGRAHSARNAQARAFEFPRLLAYPSCPSLVPVSAWPPPTLSHSVPLAPTGRLFWFRVEPALLPLSLEQGCDLISHRRIGQARNSRKSFRHSVPFARGSVWLASGQIQGTERRQAVLAVAPQAQLWPYAVFLWGWLSASARRTNP